MNKIRWRQGDYIKLGQAVAQFNKKVNQMQDDESDYLPTLYNYQDEKNRIKTRNELNRVLKSLKSFNEETAKPINLGDNQITKWENRQLKLESNRRLNQINTELNVLEPVVKSTNFGVQRYRELKRQKEKIESLITAGEEKFKDVVNYIHYVGSSDYLFKKQYVFRENYFEMLKVFKNFDNYALLENKLKSIKNPKQFWNFISQNENLSDIRLMYDMEKGLIIVNGLTAQENFDSMLESLEINIS